MTKKCAGCGALLQSDDPKQAGYVDYKFYFDAAVCRRCFRIKNYGEYQVIDKNTNDYRKFFDIVKSKKELVLFLCDVLSLDDSINELNEFKGSVILVITKIDLLPKSVKQAKLKKYINENYDLNVKEIIFLSSKKNYNIDLLFKYINEYKKSEKVYLVGNTNAGKSTLINTLIKSFNTNFNSLITTSVSPATTLDFIEVKLNDSITLIDTPGIIDNNSFLYNEKPSTIKLISCRSEIKPRTYQMKPNQSIIIDKYARIDYLSDTKNSFTLYLSNDVKVRRININTNSYLKDLKLNSFNLDDNNDIVINGLCFCKITKKAKVNVYVKENVKVYNRKNLI